MFYETDTEERLATAIRHIRSAVNKAAEEEREAIVVFLRYCVKASEDEAFGLTEVELFKMCADEIEKGEHWK
jgi:hypothetical protein